MSVTRDLVVTYLRAWNETDPARRRALVDQVFAEDAAYTDPLVQAQGRDVIDATIAGVQGMFPGHVFSLAGDVDAHHDIARFQWHLSAPGTKEPLVIGFDVAELDTGRIRRVHGFLDKVPVPA